MFFSLLIQKINFNLIAVKLELAVIFKAIANPTFYPSRKDGSFIQFQLFLYVLATSDHSLALFLASFQL